MTNKEWRDKVALREQMDVAVLAAGKAEKRLHNLTADLIDGLIPKADQLREIRVAIDALEVEIALVLELRLEMDKALLEAVGNILNNKAEA